MTYNAEADIDGFLMRAHDAACVAWDLIDPDWYEKGLDPEFRLYVSYSDVDDPETGVIRGYGGDHRRYIPGAFGE